MKRKLPYYHPLKHVKQIAKKNDHYSPNIGKLCQPLSMLFLLISREEFRKFLNELEAEEKPDKLSMMSLSLLAFLYIQYDANGLKRWLKRALAKSNTYLNIELQNGKHFYAKSGAELVSYLSEKAEDAQVVFLGSTTNLLPQLQKFGPGAYLLDLKFSDDSGYHISAIHYLPNGKLSFFNTDVGIFSSQIERLTATSPGKPKSFFCLMKYRESHHDSAFDIAINLAVLARETMWSPAVIIQDINILKRVQLQHPELLASQSCSLYITSAITGRLKVLRFLLESGLSSAHCHRLPLLIRAILYKLDRKVIQLLIEYTEDLNFGGFKEDGTPILITPLDLAVGENDFKLVKALVEAGASLSPLEKVRINYVEAKGRRRKKIVNYLKRQSAASERPLRGKVLKRSQQQNEVAFSPSLATTDKANNYVPAKVLQAADTSFVPPSSPRFKDRSVFIRLLMELINLPWSLLMKLLHNSLQTIAHEFKQVQKTSALIHDGLNRLLPQVCLNISFGQANRVSLIFHWSEENKIHIDTSRGVRANFSLMPLVETALPTPLEVLEHFSAMAKTAGTNFLVAFTSSFSKHFINASGLSELQQWTASECLEATLLYLCYGPVSVLAHYTLKLLSYLGLPENVAQTLSGLILCGTTVWNLLAGEESSVTSMRPLQKVFQLIACSAAAKFSYSVGKIAGDNYGYAVTDMLGKTGLFSQQKVNLTQPSIEKATVSKTVTSP